MHRSLLLAAGLIPTLLLSTLAAAQEGFPSKPISVIVGFAAGGGTDLYARALASVATKHLNGQPMAVVNKPGGNGVPAANFVANAPADGYTLHLASLGGLILRDIARKGPIDPIEDFAFVANVGGLTTGLFVNADSPYRSAAELIEAIREAPGRMRWAHTSRGGSHYTAGIGFMQANELDAQDVPFNGGSAARGALIGDQVDFGFIGTNVLQGFEEDLRLLAVANDERLSSVPDAPTLKELGIPYLGMFSPITMQAPAGTPAETVAILDRAIGAILQEPEVQNTLKKAGLPVRYMDAEASRAYARRIKDEWTPVVRSVTETK